MTLSMIRVECYAGQRADETPRRFCYEGNWIEVDEVLDRWYQIEDLPGWPRAEYFKLRDIDQRAYLLKHDQDADKWFLVSLQ